MTGSAVPHRTPAQRRRRIWLEIHLWLGLALGAVLSVAGVTGSILVFHHEVDAWLNPALYAVKDRGGPAVHRPFPELSAAARAAMPGDATLSFIHYPQHDDAPAVFTFSRPDPDGAGRRVEQAFVDPYDGQVLGVRLKRLSADQLPATAVGFVFELHYALLAGLTGEKILGWMTVGMLVSLISGVVLWWPRRGRWGRALTVKRGAGAARFNIDLHNVGGVYTLPLMFLVLLSGVYFVLPQQFMATARLFSPGLERRYEVKPPLQPGRPFIAPETAIEILRRDFPDGRLAWVYIPGERRPTYMICRHGADTSSLFIDRVCVVLNAYDGKLMHVETPDAADPMSAFIAWQWPLHSGQAFGEVGRWLVFVCGLVCPLIFVTGFLHWRRKRAARRIAAARAAVRA
jgi:uncharacterized iron-regulated membrane protein